MVTLSQAQKNLAVITMALILSGTIVITNASDTYYCQPEDSVRECARVSSTFRTCWWIDKDLNETRDLCSNGLWEPITKYIQLPVTPDPDKLQRLEINRPIVMTNAQITRQVNGTKYVQGWCASTISGVN